MVYCGSSFIEMIAMCPEGTPEETHFIEMQKGDRMFQVTYCCDPDWCYRFYLNSQSDYERVKFNIMETLFECKNAKEMLDQLSEIFEDGFSDILIEDCDEETNNDDVVTENKYLN